MSLTKKNKIIIIVVSLVFITIVSVTIYFLLRNKNNIKDCLSWTDCTNKYPNTKCDLDVNKCVLPDNLIDCDKLNSQFCLNGVCDITSNKCIIATKCDVGRLSNHGTCDIECKTNEECIAFGLGFRCDANRCTKDCNLPGDCPANYFCSNRECINNDTMSQVVFKNGNDNIVLNEGDLQKLAGLKNIMLSGPCSEGGGGKQSEFGKFYGAWFDPIDKSSTNYFIQIGNTKLFENRFNILNGANFIIRPYMKRTILKKSNYYTACYFNQEHCRNMYLSSGIGGDKNKYAARGPGEMVSESLDNHKWFIEPSIQPDNKTYYYTDQLGKTWIAPGWALLSLKDTANFGGFVIKSLALLDGRVMPSSCTKECNFTMVPNDGNPTTIFRFTKYWPDCT